MAHRYGKGVTVLDKFIANGVSIFSFTKNTFADRIITLMLVYRKQFMLKQEFFQMLQYLIATNFTDIIVGDFDYYLLKVLEKNVRYFHRSYSHHIYLEL